MRKPFHGKRRKVTESGGIFLRDDYQFTCRSQPLESRLYFLDVMPIEGVMISQFLIIRSIHLQNTLLAVALPGLCGAINILLMTNAFKSIPMELEEAAMVDGANLWQRFFHICVPQVKGTMTVVGIFAFVGAWNDFLWPLIAISDESKYTLTLGMNRLKGMFIQDPRLIAAGALVSLIPIIVFFCCFQRYFFRGLEQGGLKG